MCQLQAELTKLKMETQKQESQLKHAVATSEQRNSDFDLAIKARDEAVKESKRLLKHTEALEESHRAKASPPQLTSFPRPKILFRLLQA